MEIYKARETIQRMGEDKRKSLEGGGKDFQGALKRLVGIWRDPSHALIELLQNADDAEATTVEYKISPNGILFKHNGHPFTEREVRAICSVDDTTKDVEKHTGFMGIGFKAVFKLSTSPFILCAPWQFCFSPDGFLPGDWGWILVPRWVESIPSEVGEVPDGNTVYWLPYKEELSKDAIGRIEGDIFERFDSLCLMFLRNIRQIQIQRSDGRTRKLRCEDDTVIEDKDGEETPHRYKVFRKLFRVPDEAKVGYPVQDSGRDKAKVREILLVFALDSKGNLQPMTNSPLYTYLPTDCFPGLRFVVQGDFILDSQRSNVDESLEWNQWLWRCVKDLLIDAIEGFIDDKDNHVEGFKNSERLRYQFYRVLPSKGDFASTSGESVIQTELIEPFWDYCRENPVIVTSSNAWAKPSEAVLTTPEVQELLDTEKLKALTKREHFVHANVQEVRGLLLDMGVTDFPEREILEALEDHDWVNSKDSQWFSQLYVFLWDRLYDDENRWTDWWRQEVRAKSLPIVRISEGIAKNPDEVLFPPVSEKETELATGIPGILFVDGSFLEGTAQKVLENLGVRTLGAENVIRAVIIEGFEDGTWQDWSEGQLERCVRFVREWLKRRQWKPPADLQRKLGAARVRTEGGVLERADKCYCPEHDLKFLFPEGNFARLHESDEDQHKFLLALGVKDKPLLFVDEDEEYGRYYGPDFASGWKDYWSWLDGEHYLPRSTWYQKVSKLSCLDGWDRMQWSSEVAEVMLGCLVRHWEGEYKSHMKSSYEYYFRTSKTEEVPSYFAWQLLETKWLPTDKGLMEPSAEIFLPLPKIKKVVGDLVPYISIPGSWKEQEFLVQGQEFFKSLELRTELDIEALRYLLEVAQDNPVDDNLRIHLSRIYRALGRLLEEENGSELRKLKLLTEARTFEDSTSLYWNDDPDLGAHFQDAEGLRFAWIPDGVERRYIEILFQQSGVKVLSKHASRELVRPVTAEASEKWVDSLRRKAIYIYSLLKHHNADRAVMAGEKLSKVLARSSDRIEVLIGLDGVERTAIVDAFYDVDGDVFYLVQDVEGFEISLELARAFGLDFAYISDIEVILHQEDDRIEERLQRQGIALLHWETEPLPPVTVQQEEKPEDQQEEMPEVVREIEASQLVSVEEEESVISRAPRRQVQRTGLSYDERMKEEVSNIERIIRFEEDQGRSAKDVSKEYRGFDLESIDKATNEIRYIEAKAPSHVMLTPHEYEVAKEKGSSYYLYVVDHDILFIKQDPANSCSIASIETLETRWKIRGWRENALMYELPM